jgi:hypothetical protein
MLTTMTNYYLVEPEVAGGLGPWTISDRSVHPPRVTRLEYVFDGWLGDPLLESFPCFISTRTLALKLAELGASGYVERPVRVSKSYLFREIQPETELPEFVWLDVTGQPGVDDCGADASGNLVVSEPVLAVLVEAGIPNADVSDWPGGLG